MKSSQKPKLRQIILWLLLFVLAACSSNTLPLPEDNYTLVTPTALPTDPPPPTPEPIVEDAGGIGRAFINAWEAKDYLGMYSLLAPQVQAVVDSQSFVKRYEEIMAAAAVQQVIGQPQALNQQGNQASMRVRVTWETAVVGPITRDIDIPFIFNEGRWGILWDESLILPELSGGNNLYLEYRIPSRGNIYDIHGGALAYQGTIISLGIIPGQIEDEEALLTVLSEVLQKPPEEIQAMYASALPDWYVPIGDIVEERMQAYSLALQPFFGKGLAEPRTRLSRLYTPEGIAAHIVGYTGYISAEQLDAYKAQGYRGDEQVGVAGLEFWGEDYLNGERGGILSLVGPSGEYLDTIQEKPSLQARSLYTTIDRDFQAAVEQALAEAIETYPDTNAGAVVVLDVNTGQVRAMASYPSFNPVVFDPFRPESAVALGQVLSNPQRPLLNRATQGAYPSGSLFKIVTLAAALNSGLYTPDTLYTSTGTWSRLGDAFVKKDWKEGGHGTISIRQALVVSCNSCFYDAGYNLDEFDPNFLPETAMSFGLGQETGIQIPEAAGLIPTPEWKLANTGEGWARGDAVNMAIGQGFVQVTPLQMANMVAAVANGGTLYRPTLIDRIGAGAGAPEEPWPVEIIGQLPISPEYLAVIQDSMYKVANDQNNGTAAYQFVGLPVRVAGKTGTAEDPPRNSHAWFAGYAPAAPYTLADGTTITEPEIAIAVIAENAGEGSEVAAPIFRRIVELYYGITPVTPYPWVELEN